MEGSRLKAPNKSIGLEKKIANVLAHAIIGALPRQDYLEDKFSWYHSKAGCFFNSLAEFIPSVCIQSYYLSGSDIDPLFVGASAFFALDGMMRYGQIIDEPKLQKGNYLLELIDHVYNKCSGQYKIKDKGKP